MLQRMGGVGTAGDAQHVLPPCLQRSLMPVSRNSCRGGMSAFERPVALALEQVHTKNKWEVNGRHSQRLLHLQVRTPLAKSRVVAIGQEWRSARPWWNALNLLASHGDQTSARSKWLPRWSSNPRENEMLSKSDQSTLKDGPYKPGAARASLQRILRTSRLALLSIVAVVTSTFGGMGAQAASSADNPPPALLAKIQIATQASQTNRAPTSRRARTGNGNGQWAVRKSR